MGPLTLRSESFCREGSTPSETFCGEGSTPLFDFPRCTVTELRFKPGPCVLNSGETCGADGPASLIKGTWRFFGVHLPHRVFGGCHCDCNPVRLLQEMECGDVRTGVYFLCVPSPSFSLLLRCTLTWNCVSPSSCHHPTRDPTVCVPWR